MQKITQFLIGLVKQSSKLINKKTNVHKKDTKGDLVTDFDYAIEKFMIKQINAAYPDFGVLSEEFNAHANVQKNYFLIDPIDGTINFANNIPLWGIQVACVQDGKICSAVIYLPEFNELYYADKNGAYLNDKKIKIKNNPNNKNLFGLMDRHNQNFVKNVNHYRYICCACVTYTWVTKQCVCAVLFKCDDITKNWDAAPGVYIAMQAGCVLERDGNTYAIADNVDSAKYLLNIVR